MRARIGSGVRRLVVLGVLVACAAGCAASRPSRSAPSLGESVPAVYRDMRSVRDRAARLAERAAREARRLKRAREQGDEAAIEALLVSLNDNKAAIDALDQAVRTLEFVLSYTEQRDRIALAAKELERLDEDVELLREGALEVERHAEALIAARERGEEEAVKKALAEIERDRVFLDALKTDLLIMARFGRRS